MLRTPPGPPLTSASTPDPAAALLPTLTELAPRPALEPWLAPAAGGEPPLTAADLPLAAAIDELPFERELAASLESCRDRCIRPSKRETVDASAWPPDPVDVPLPMGVLRLLAPWADGGEDRECLPRGASQKKALALRVSRGDSVDLST
jgi:hypothetical protein